MKTYKIGFKGFYRETSDHLCEYIRRRNKTAALKAFAETHKVPNANVRQPKKWQWWEDEWLYEFRGIEPVKVVSCPDCAGTGKIAVPD
jgi:hypothetical protein